MAGVNIIMRGGICICSFNVPCSGFLGGEEGGPLGGLRSRQLGGPGSRERSGSGDEEGVLGDEEVC